jgi:signal transduction histidine kinase
LKGLVSATYSPTHDAGGVVDGWVAVVIDIHERRRSEEVLREADRRKDEFLATLSHELRGPLAPIRNAVQVMKLADVPDPTLRSARDMIDRQVGQMALLIDDLLDISRITLGKLDLRRRTELASAVHQAVETARPHAECAGHELTVHLPPEPVYVNADPTRLAQVFSNLLTNACKYTEKGGHISLTAVREGGDVVVAVKDDGIGIAPEHLPVLFEKFSQVAPALERSQGGLGVGLSHTDQAKIRQVS